MENYFVVLQLPKDRELKFTGGNNDPKNFWGKAARAIAAGKAKLISRRPDTGVSEELQSYAKKKKKFKTYILVNMQLDKREEKSTIFKKAAQRISGSKKATIIDTTDKFTLITAEA